MPSRGRFRTIASNPSAYVRRALSHFRSGDASPALEWAEQQAEDAGEVLGALDPALWEEAERFAVDTQARVAEMRAAGAWPRGAGDYRILYFLVRHRQPAIVVETGVAFGFSTRSVLSAFVRNGHGHLYSSDLPYPRSGEDPQDLIGSFVEEELRGDAWTLDITGDRRALPRFAAQLSPGSVDLFHYDSDKSPHGRSFAIDVLTPVLATDALVLIDDINDNLWFKRFVEVRDEPFKVFRFVEDWPKYIGVVGL